jgi:hypothetical protein
MPIHGIRCRARGLRLEREDALTVFAWRTTIGIAVLGSPDAGRGDQTTHPEGDEITMGKTFENINPAIADWIAQQRLFFVGTAPLAEHGHVNVSPKGGEAFRVLGPLEVVYHDYTGSGAETAAHVRENGRIVILFCAFDGPPRIVRLHGRGTLVTADHDRFAEFAAAFPPNPGTRSFVHVAVDRVSDSCGYSVPRFDYQGPRDTLDRWAEKKGEAGLEAYRADKNQRSIDGLPAFPVERRPKTNP